MHSDAHNLDRILHFLDTINITVEERELNDDTFLPGLTLEKNAVVIDRARLKYPGDVLHEAGHLAVAPPSIRPLLGAKDLDWPTDGEELGAILWSYAALLHIGLAPEVVFHPDGYKGDSEWMMEKFEEKDFIGLPYLQWIGLCEKPEEFPKLTRWIRVEG